MRILLALSTLCASVALIAQPGPGGGQGRGPSRSLAEMGAGYLSVPAVQKELGLSAAIIKKINDGMAAAMKGMNPGQGAPPDRTAMEKAFEKMRAAQAQALGMLSAGQKARLKQITLQQMGGRAFRNKEVQSALKITPDQSKRLDAAIDDANKGMGGGFGRGQGGQRPSQQEMEKMMKEFQAKRAAANAKISAAAAKILTAAQKSQWSAMLGKPFKVDPSQMRGGMGRMRMGGGPGGGNRGGGR